MEVKKTKAGIYTRIHFDGIHGFSASSTGTITAWENPGALLYKKCDYISNNATVGKKSVTRFNDLLYKGLSIKGTCLGTSDVVWSPNRITILNKDLFGTLVFKVDIKLDDRWPAAIKPPQFAGKLKS